MFVAGDPKMVSNYLYLMVFIPLSNNLFLCLTENRDLLLTNKI